MKVLKILSGVFGTVGVGMLAGSFFILSHTRGFIAGASEAEGKVIALDRSTSSSNSGSRSTAYRPVVGFASGTGKRFEFTSSVGSSPPSHRVGESVTVLYNPADPSNARIKSFVQLWFGFLIVFVLGLVFAAIGLGMIFVRARGRSRAEWLRQNIWFDPSEYSFLPKLAE